MQGYVLVQGILQWPHLNSNAEIFSDVLVYKAMSLLDTFPIGDPEVLMSFLTAQYPGAPFVTNAEINLVFAQNIVSLLQQRPAGAYPAIGLSGVDAALLSVTRLQRVQRLDDNG